MHIQTIKSKKGINVPSNKKHIAALLAILVLPSLLFSSCAAIAEMNSDPPDNTDSTTQISDPAALAEWVADGIITVSEYTNSSALNANFTLFSRTDDQYVYIGIKAKATGWISIGFQPLPAKGHTSADFALGGVSNGAAYIYDLWGLNKEEHSLDTKLGGTSSILEYGGTESGGYTILEFKRLLTTGDTYDQNIVHGSNNILWAYSDEDGFAAMHISEGTGKINIP
ncbi:DOMON domain-containing protein [Dehalococcoides mccartyi]|nr:DOMON domain-containing protein [Dehalococcoides mccartyi]